MNGNDDKLKALLHQWRDIEPAANFEAQVHRRLQVGRAVPARRPLAWFWQPAFAVATAVIVSALISLSFRPAPKELGFLSDGSLTGGYLRVAR